MRDGGGSVGIRTIKSPYRLDAILHELEQVLKILLTQNFKKRAAEIRWGKKWGKIANHEKQDSHKKIQPPLSDWIL